MKGPLVVVGDALLDVDLVGSASRLTPDAPVPVVEDVQRHERPGGAALAAVIAASSTTREVVLVAPLDSDDGAERLRALLDGRVTLLPIPATGGTAVKQRVRVGDHSVVRIDSGSPLATLGALPESAAAAIRDAAAVLVADYGRGRRRRRTSGRRWPRPADRWSGTRTRGVRTRCPRFAWSRPTGPRRPGWPPRCRPGRGGWPPSGRGPRR
ncbi:MAG TPA: hypothetical protein VGD12_15320 [Blastococcus sp.]